MPGSHRYGLAPAGIDHPRVRQFLNIKRKGSPGGIALEGLWAIRHAVAAAVPVEAVFVCPDLVRGPEGDRLVDDVQRGGAAALRVSERVLRRMVDRDGPDGLAAVASWKPRRLAEVAVGETTCIVVADGIELAGNLGTLIRCADGAGAAGVLVTDHHIRLSHPLVLKASMATVLSMPVVEVDRSSALEWLLGRGVRVVAADPSARTSYRDADYRGPVAIVVGSERSGLASCWREAADVVVSIPMLGVADSLNVGHAAALLLYEALHQHLSGPHA